MRLSEAIALGRSLIDLNPFKWSDGKCGCAIGMAAAAVSREFTAPEQLVNEFPVLMHKCPFPENAYHPLVCNFVGAPSPVWKIVSGLAYNVRDGKLTMDQLIDWVRSIEPAEEEVNHEESTQPVACVSHR